MKNKNRSIALTLSICIILGLFVQLFLPTVALASEEIIYIGSSEELQEFAKKCSYDAFSINKSVILTADISLEGIDFEPIATFSGSFDGQEHTISGLDLSGAYSPAGLFSTLGKDAAIKDLTVKGVVSPSGDKGCVGGIVGDNSGRIKNCEFIGTVIGSSDIGGIAGINRLSGTISDCTVSGEIIGENRTGGIAGSNEGLISSNESEAKVNTISVTPTLSLDEINISLTLDIKKLPSLNNTTMSDSGGISGYSTGIIIGCVNNGAVGYPHIGYNVGGIVGRSSGHLNGNINNAKINGRKDVGGIVGQMEPHVSYDLSEDLLALLKTELDRLSATVNGAVGSAESGIPTISSRLDAILENLDGATDSLDKIIKDGTDYGDDFLGEINRVSEIVSEVISQISGITDELPELSQLLGDSLGKLESAFGNIEEFSSISAGALDDINEAIKDASSAFGQISESIARINAALAQFDNALVIKDKDGAAEAINRIADGLGNFIRATDSFTSALNYVTRVLGDTPWMDGAIANVLELIRVFGNMSESISEIYDATLEIGRNIDIYWEKFEKAGDELVNMIGRLADTTENLVGAIELMDDGITKISDGLEMLSDSLTINDPQAAEDAIERIGIGFNRLIEAGESFSNALSEISGLLDNLEDSEGLGDILSSASGAIRELAEAGLEMAEATSGMQEGVTALFDSISIDFDNLNGGGSLIIAGVGDIADSFDKTRDAVRAMIDGIAALEGAVTQINEAVDVKDEESLKNALDSAYAALGDIIGSSVELSDVFQDMTETLSDAVIWGEELSSAIGELTETMSEISGAMVKIQDGVDLLRSNLSYNSEHTASALRLIREGLQFMANASVGIKDCFLHISDAITKIDSGSEQLNGAITDLKECVGGLTSAMDSVTRISEKIGMMLSYLKSVDTVQLPTPPESITATANQLFIYISAIENELKYLNTDMTGLSSELVEQIGSINEIFDDISDNIVSMIYSLNDGSFIDNNVSEEEIDSVTQGKIFSCTNTGDVYGDINVGGISGAMGLEYTLDPEDDLSGELSVTQKKQYKLKAVIHACHNEGSVTSKYDCAGGIVGKMDIGLIYGCEAYCKVESQSGSYVGGIAGITVGLISQSFAKCSLYGGKYVGGIVGSGVTESYSGDSSMVRSCYSMVEIKRYTQYAGAISGINAGEFSENLFVSDTLAGIDRVSYLGKAEPISYQDLIKRRSIPDEFHRFTLEFIADGEVLHSVKFEYGSSFDISVFPEIPSKAGHYGYWDRTSLENLVFDTTVSVVYKPYITAIGSEESREDGREIFFVQGEFVEDDGVSVKEGCDTSNLTLIEKLFTKDTLVESWVLTIPNDNLDVNNIHFLPENEHARIFVKIDGSWQEIEATEFGSYLIFDVSGEKIEIAVIEHSVKIVPVLILCVGALIILASVIIVCVIVRRRARTKARAKKDDESSADEKSEA